jgi:hypothetical protein
MERNRGHLFFLPTSRADGTKAVLRSLGTPRWSKKAKVFYVPYKERFVIFLLIPRAIWILWVNLNPLGGFGWGRPSFWGEFVCLPLLST